MNIRKYLIPFLIIYSIICCFFGCAAKKMPLQPNLVSSLASDYLHKTYDDSFQPKAYTSFSWYYDYATVIFSSGKYPNARVEVRVYENEDGTYRFADNYYQHIMHNDAVQYINELINIKDAHVKVRFSNAIWSDDLNGAKTFLEWINNKTCVIDIFVFTEEVVTTDTNSTLFNTIVEAIAAEKISGNVSFYTVNSTEAVTNADLNTILNNQSNYIKFKTEYRISHNFDITKIK